MKWILLFTVVFSLPVLALERDMTNYISTQTFLAGDNFAAALKSYNDLCSTKNIGSDLCVKNATTIAAIRDSFKKLSTLYIASFDKSKSPEMIVVECPMAKAKWIQKKGTIQNPYYGSEMLTCGYEVDK